MLIKLFVFVTIVISSVLILVDCSCSDKVHRVKDIVFIGMPESEVSKIMRKPDKAEWVEKAEFEEYISEAKINKITASGEKVWALTYYCKCFGHISNTSKEIVTVLFDRPNGHVIGITPMELQMIDY